MTALLRWLYPIISIGVWVVALFGFDFLAKDLSKKNKIIATICLILAFVAWFEGTGLHDEDVRRSASQKLIENLQDDNVLPEGDYSAYYELYSDIDMD